MIKRDSEYDSEASPSIHEVQGAGFRLITFVSLRIWAQRQSRIVPVLRVLEVGSKCTSMLNLDFILSKNKKLRKYIKARQSMDPGGSQIAPDPYTAYSCQTTVYNCLDYCTLKKYRRKFRVLIKSQSAVRVSCLSYSDAAHK